MEQPISVGIDVSKATLDLAIVPLGLCEQVPNSRDGWDRIVQLLAPLAPAWIVIEATGSYHLGLAVTLTEANLIPSVVNPSSVRFFAKSIGLRAKTDRIDASVLARYGIAVQPSARPAPTELIRRIQALLTRHAQLASDKATERVRRDHADASLQADITEHIGYLTQRLAEVDALIDSLVASDPVLAGRTTSLRTVPGIGRQIATVLAVYLPELGGCSHKQLAALVGVAPFARDSGGFRGKRYTYGGRAAVRTALYQAVTTGRRWNAVVNTFYTRLRARDKAHKVAMVATMNKLLGILNAMTRDGLTWPETNAACSEFNEPATASS